MFVTRSHFSKFWLSFNSLKKNRPLSNFVQTNNKIRPPTNTRNSLLPSWTVEDQNQREKLTINNFERDVEILKNFLLPEKTKPTKKTLVITGAGVSTDSGIPDYRSPGRPQTAPIQHSEFISSLASRKRYWSRSFRGFPLIREAKPNKIHNILTILQNQELVIPHIITQNVDGLHEKAGNKGVVNLHGSLHYVNCLSCDFKIEREKIQEELRILNGYDENFNRETRIDPVLNLPDTSSRPDGDVDLGLRDYNSFKIPDCPKCAGTLKPSIIFFGGTIEDQTKHQSYKLLNYVEYPHSQTQAHSSGEEICNQILILGSTIVTWSVFRLVRFALNNRKIPIVIINRGPTRVETEYRVFDRYLPHHSNHYRTWVSDYHLLYENQHWNEQYQRSKIEQKNDSDQRKFSPVLKIEQSCSEILESFMNSY